MNDSSSFNDALRFPTPVGGTPLRLDAVPSIIFDVALGLLIPFVLSRLFIPARRCSLLLGTCVMVVDRVVLYAFRASQSYNIGPRQSVNILIYQQISFAQGFLGILHDLVGHLRVLLVQATNPPYLIDSIHQTDTDFGDVKLDMPRTRHWVRRICDLLVLVFFAATIPTFYQGALFHGAVDGDQSKADSIMTIRYLHTGIATFILFSLGAITVWGYLSLPDIRRDACVRILTVLAILLPIPVYRFIVMHFTIPNLLSAAPGSQESPGAKAAFYVFHCLPEFFACALLVIPNTRKVFCSGPYGDWRSSDETKSCSGAMAEAREKEAEKKRRNGQRV